jgi:hypothetical protein
MAGSKEARNKAPVLKAFETLFNKQRSAPFIICCNDYRSHASKFLGKGKHREHVSDGPANRLAKASPKHK